ncbi:MAG: DUF748 domain-containing protein [Deltaproteobacteria bacterium]|nr:DUF748 domain-containing protein [Deltaproteobacteria bacterium]
MLALAVFAALVVAAVGSFALLLPRLVNTPEFRAALAARATEALGTPVEWKSLGIGIFPPRVTLEAPVLVGQNTSPEATASVRADAIDLRLSLWPLLERRIAVDSLVLHGVVLVATRTPEGLILPEIARAASKTGDEAEADSAATRGDPADDAFTLDLRALRIVDGRVLLYDRTLTPPVALRLDDFELDARGRSLGEPLDVEATARLFANDRALGGATATGRVDLKGEYAVDLVLEGLPVTELRAFLPDVDVSKGVLAGRISASASPGSAVQLAGDVEIEGLALRFRGVELLGDLAVRAKQKPADALGFEATWTTADAGRADVTGERAGNGDLELTAMLEALELAPFAALAGEGRRLEGRATGEVSVALASGRLSRLESDLVIESARYADGRIDAKGKLDLAVGLEGAGDDAPARIQAVFAPESGGRVDVNGTGTLGGAVRGALRFDAFDVSLLAPLMPDETSVSGKLTGELELETTAGREIERLASKLRIGSARLVRGTVDVAGDLAVDARTDASGPVVLAAKATLADGGRVGVSGTSTRKGELDLDLELAGFDLAALTPFVDSPELELAGRVTGRGRLEGPYASLASLALDLAVEGSAIRRGELRLSGPFSLALDVAKPLAPERHGRIDVDLALAEAHYGETFVKPAGVRAKLATKFESRESGDLAFESRGPLNNINELVLRGTLGPKTTLALTTSSFDLKGWSGLLPVLADYQPEGALAFEGLSLVRSEGAKDRFDGRIALRSVDLTLPGSGRVRLKGTLDGAGERIDLNGVSATLHGLTLGLDGHVDEPLADARFEVAAHSIGEAEANDLASGLANVHDVLFGALRFDARLAGAAAGEASLYDTLSGDVRFSVGESGGGRLRGISLLQTTLAQIPLFGDAARIATRLRAQPGEADHVAGNLSERFELLEGDLAIGEGRIDARTLRLRYRGHEARLTGRMELEGLGLDMRGELLLDSPLVAALAGRPAAELAGRPPVRIPLAHVTNTLSSPKVSLTAETLAAVPQLLLLTTGVGQVVDQAVGQATKQVGRVGEEVGEAVGGALGKLGRKLGGGDGGDGGDEKKRKASEAQPGGPAGGAARPDAVPAAASPPEAPAPSVPSAPSAPPSVPEDPSTAPPTAPPIVEPAIEPPASPTAAPTVEPTAAPSAPPAESSGSASEDGATGPAESPAPTIAPDAAGSP